MLAISTGSLEEIQKAQTQYPALPCLLARDEDGAVIRKLGLVHHTMGRDLAAPASILVDKHGVVRWTHYAGLVSDRPNPQVVLREVQKLVPEEEGGTSTETQNQ